MNFTSLTDLLALAAFIGCFHITWAVLATVTLIRMMARNGWLDD